MKLFDGGADLAPLLGECAWHSLTVDPSIEEVSEQHFTLVRGLLERYRLVGGRRPPAILEVACYAHTTGYALARRLGAAVTLFEISARTLQLGRRVAGQPAGADNPRLVVGDFHDLPFRDGSFDFVFICSALHHTWRWQRVASELQRVLAPGGVLFFENEPCHRACCFYKFRTNRPHDFTPFEARLNELGLLHTVAEPYPGSRPESLFGMIENQTIPLDHLLEQLNSTTEVVDTTVTPETCMTPMNQAWLSQAGLGAPGLAGVIERDLVEACRAAEPAFDDVARGLGFGLPTPEEIRPLARQTAARIVALQQAEPPLGPLQHRVELAKLFGAPVRLVARKPPGPDSMSRGEFKRPYPGRDGITYTFAEPLSGLLMDRQSLWPDLQEAPAEELARFFPGPEWQRLTEANGVTVLLLAGTPARIKLPATPDELLLVLRMNGGPPPGCHLRVALRHGGREVPAHTFWRPEAALCVLQVGPSPGQGSQLELHCEAVAKDGSRAPAPHHLNLVYVGLLPVPWGRARASA